MKEMFDKSIESDKRNPDFPVTLTVLGTLKGVKSVSAVHYPSF